MEVTLKARNWMWRKKKKKLGKFVFWWHDCSRASFLQPLRKKRLKYIIICGLPWDRGPQPTSCIGPAKPENALNAQFVYSNLHFETYISNLRALLVSSSFCTPLTPYPDVTNLFMTLTLSIWKGGTGSWFIPHSQNQSNFFCMASIDNKVILYRQSHLSFVILLVEYTKTFEEHLF